VHLLSAFVFMSTTLDNRAEATTTTKNRHILLIRVSLNTVRTSIDFFFNILQQ